MAEDFGIISYILYNDYKSCLSVNSNFLTLPLPKAMKMKTVDRFIGKNIKFKNEAYSDGKIIPSFT